MCVYAFFFFVLSFSFLFFSFLCCFCYFVFLFVCVIYFVRTEVSAAAIVTLSHVQYALKNELLPFRVCVYSYATVVLSFACFFFLIAPPWKTRVCVFCLVVWHGFRVVAYAVADGLIGAMLVVLRMRATPTECACVCGLYLDMCLPFYERFVVNFKKVSDTFCLV